MTHPVSDTASAASQPKAESFVDWFHINSRLITIGAIALAVVAFGVWFVQRKSLNESISSDKQLVTAKQSLASGNAPLAEADLRKVMDKYPNKPAGAEAGMILAQLRLDRGDNVNAVAVLRELVGKIDDGPNAASVRGMLGAALMQSDKPAEAAVEYEKAAALTTMPNEKSYLQSQAARAYVLAGKASEARKLLEPLAAQSSNEALATEAHVRLGELASASKP
jgi:Flp pilus assembly protein TadD